MISDFALLIALYSALQDDNDIVSCFFDFQETNEVPIMMQKLERDFLVIWQPT